VKHIFAGDKPSGTATLDFGTGVNVAEVVVTGVGAARSNSIITVEMRIEATANHSVDDLLFDPIRVEAHTIVAGTGFTIFGKMGNARANGLYFVNWAIA
jgi:hypothetical protein